MVRRLLSKLKEFWLHRHAEVEAEWYKFVIDNYTNAIKKAKEAIKSL